jgi:hypothetical protein
VGKAANAELAAKLADLKNRNLNAKSDYRVLSNPSFEPLAGAGRIAGWHLTANSGTATVELDTKTPQEGKSCLHFGSDGQPATVESDTFPAPPTGQLAMTVYARGQNLAPGTELRLIVEGDCDGRPYRRAARVPANAMQRPNNEWGGSFAIFVRDLPLQSPGQMRIAFELTGAGEVWLDNVKLSSVLWTFADDSKADCLQLSRMRYAANSALDAGQITDCSRIIDGYWPRFILEYRPPNVPLVAERVAPASPPASPPQADQGQEPSPGLGDRLKRFVPFAR